ncbi:hypothetical protein OROGR_012124 [Orobanche gracilis]
MMATPPRSHSPTRSCSDSPPQTSSKMTRKPTRCKYVTKTRLDGSKLPLDIDTITGKTKRTHNVKLSSYLGKLAREHVSILHPTWRLVPDQDKEMIWLDVLNNFNIPNEKQRKEKILQSVGLKWRQFKSYLSREWVFGDHKHMSPCLNYNISSDDWDEFKRSRLDPSWEIKRSKAQEIQKLNTCPHIMSRGGYDLLDEKIMTEKLKKRQEEASQSGSDAVVDPPSPPTRHQRWKRGRIRKSGELINDEAREIAKRIDDLEDECSRGSFVPHGCDDILSNAIGRQEHPGRVRGVASGIGIREYFGSRSCGSTRHESISPEFVQSLTKKIAMEVTQNLMKQFGPVLASLGAYSQPPPVTPRGHVSTNGSCAAPPDFSLGETHIDISGECGLYIDGQPLRLVALGRVLEGGSTIHGVPLSDDLVRVTVVDIRDADAEVPIPTSEINIVGEAVGGFIAWPKRLVKDISKEVIAPQKKQVNKVEGSTLTDNPIAELLKAAASLYSSPLQVAWDSILFGVEHDVPLYLSHDDVLEIFHGNVCLSLSVMQFWILLLHKLSVEMGNDDVYGFLEPQSIQYTGNKENEVSKYLLKHMRESNKKIYLGAYHHENHWQLLIIIPNEGLAVWLCSVHAKPDAAMKVIVHSVVTPFKMLGGIHNKSKHNLIWLYPKCNKQVRSWECGYYVMYWMLTIIRASINKSWQEIFNDTSALSGTSIEEIRTQWAKHFWNITDEKGSTYSRSK